MDSLIKRIKQRLGGGRAADKTPHIVVAAFGKHPGWDDHMEDIGLGTDALVTAKRILYVQGIAENIDSGRWSQLESRQLAVEFGHVFVWRRNGEILAGRLWPSCDGRGRTSYPMIVCAHCRGISLRDVYSQVLPRLADFETKCRSSGSAKEVRGLVLTCQQACLESLEVRDASEDDSMAGTDPMACLAEYRELGPGDEGLLRVLYHIDREIMISSLPLVVKGECQHSVLARVPLLANHVPEAAILWMEFLLDKYGRQCGVLALTPVCEKWLDLIVGEPAPAQLYCLRASIDALPATTAVPYNISQEFAEKVRGRIVAARIGAVKDQDSCREARSPDAT